MYLSEHNLNSLPSAVPRPRYDRTRVIPAIVHLGAGAFHRAHQAVYTDAVLASGDLAWGIVGAGLLSTDTRDALAGQDNLYTLTTASPQGRGVQVIGSIVRLLGGRDDLSAALDVMCAGTTRIVSLTITEKGYYLDPATGALQFDAPQVRWDLAHPSEPRTMLGLIVQSLQNRWVRGIAPFTVLSCDNLPSNGKRAKAAVIAYAQQLDPEFATWIDSHVRFPCTMVDRITPATTDTDRMQVAAAIGMIDAWPVVAEPFTQWIIEDDFSMGRPDWTLGGAIFSNDIEHWECMKLQCLNGAHSTLAYLGQLAGCETVAQAMDVPFIAETLDTLWGEVSAVIQPPDGVDLAQYVDSLRQRFRNPAIRHRTAQIAMDGSQKLPQRLLTPLRARIQRGLPSPAIATAVAAWMHFAVRTARTPGQALDDPLSAEILARARAACTTSAIVNSLLSLQKVFANDLPMAGNFRTELLTAFSAIAANPALATFDKTNTSG